MPKCYYLMNETTGKVVTFDSLKEYEIFIKEVGNWWKPCECKIKDYNPKEPLIKDEKVRKALRAWADANEYVFVKVSNDMVSEPNCGNVQIHFENTNIIDEDKYGIHTIEELCGEELRPVIVGDIKYESYDDYLKRRKKS